jgi:hypothetical protein
MYQIGLVSPADVYSWIIARKRLENRAVFQQESH